MLDVNRLRVFRSVVASGSVSAAATRLGYTPSAVSQHISALQRETGLTLFEKSGRGIVPTAHGRELASRSEELMSSLQKLDVMVDDLRAGRTGRLTVGTFASAGEWWLPSVATTVVQEFPDTQLIIELTDPPTTAQPPDIDIRTENPAEEPTVPTGFTRCEITTEPYVLLLHRDHPLADREQVAAAELADELWIRDDIAESTCSRITKTAWRSAGFTPKSIIQAADHHGAIAFVAAGLGVCVMPRLAAATIPDQVRRLALVDPTPERRIAAYVHDSARSHPATARIVDLIRTAAAAPLPADQPA
ncbi:LysR family transcriptional regulator [Calidifontibacter sp. DB0510]|uniref:LysR family transcriptional regulator n=1 Tax=Metallococcus carri TaxID=1656884 RepID=A0A967B1B8_9MICO|nr:LysR family transcriptional regulator [Metallococcus carri]NHN56227.1 LysR family transcriptional regulator [Metallococcus carri]NOP38722.1 LysR family transcriptional regulator [Calidifontibacter sp. DB2511S]